MALGTPTEESWGERTSGDLSSLLVEFARGLKGLRFYARDHPSGRDILERAYMAWRVEIDRAGPVELRIEANGFRAAGVTDGVPLTHLRELTEALRDQGLRELCVTTDVTRQSFQEFAELLARDSAGIEADGGFANAFSQIANEGIGLPGLLEERTPAAPSHAPLPEEPIEEADPTASLGSALLSAQRHGEGFEDFTKPCLEEDPLAAAAVDPADESIQRLLRELDSCLDDVLYDERLEAVSALAEKIGRDGHASARYRAVLVLADHTVPRDGRSAQRIQSAQAELEELCLGDCLRELIDRAADPESSVSVRAAQVLLQLGGRAVGPLLERLEVETDSERSGQMAAVVVALGERAVPILVARLRSPDVGKARAAVKMAGELQSPRLVKPLVKILEANQPELWMECARALVQIADPNATESLIRALESEPEQRAKLAAQALGAIDARSGGSPLLAALDRALPQGRFELAREIVRSLGRIRHVDAIPRLVSLLDQRSFRHRKERAGLKRAAVTALVRLPGREARRAVERAAQSRNADLREAAERALQAVSSEPHPEVPADAARI